MTQRALLALTTGLTFVGMGSLWMRHGTSSVPAQGWWIIFLVLMPLGLAILLRLKLRWAAMACVIYGTVGLALDLATTVQILTKGSDGFVSVVSSAVSGFLNFLLIMFGGRSFLDVAKRPLPQGSHPPNPPSPF